ncbi:MAG: E3 binding domain-containing protein, partial [Terrimicrobiaceae bacterium]|nr:E3 binding domain-containing protein [Terrimicrobiaceae bacterium]
MPLITMPKLSDTMVEGTIARWLKKPGDAIEIGDILAEVETDKATMEMEAFDEGILKEIYVGDGGTAKIGEKIALLLAEGETPEAAAADKAREDLTTQKSAETAPHPVPHHHGHGPHASAVGDRVKASPLAKKLAKERGVSLLGIHGTGPGGRIVARDVPAAAQPAVATPAAAAAPPAPAAAPPIPPPEPSASDRRIALTGMRRVIAERLLASKTQIPHFYLSLEAD